jgi:hypothetical protein
MWVGPVVLLLLVLGVLALVLGGLRLRRGRWLGAGFDGLLGLALLLAGVALAGVAANLHTYQRLTHEQPVADLSFVGLGAGQYQVYLRYPDGQARLFTLNGDEWQLDARVLKWRGVANLAGLDAHYRLERIRGRHRDLERERTGPHSVYDLARDPGLDLWRVAERHGRWLPVLDAVYGSAAYLPMSDGAEYRIWLSQSGLVARPLNAKADGAIRTWR